MTRALGVRSREMWQEMWQVITGLLSVQLEPSKTMENPHVSFLALPSHARTTPASSFPRSCSGHYYACVDIAYAYVLCISYVCAGLVCVYVWWDPTIQLLVFCCSAACCCCSCTYHVCITPSLTLSSSLLSAQPRYNSRASSSPFCDGHGRCISLCVRVRAMFHM